MTFIDKLEQIMCEHEYVYMGNYYTEFPILKIPFIYYNLYKCKHCEKKVRENKQ
jgi:hypothetical protein